MTNDSHSNVFHPPHSTLKSTHKHTYIVHLGLDCTASCECHDFRKRGGACKHIHAALLRVEALHTHGVSIPAIDLPQSAEDVCTIHTHQISNPSHLEAV